MTHLHRDTGPVTERFNSSTSRNGRRSKPSSKLTRTAPQAKCIAPFSGLAHFLSEPTNSLRNGRKAMSPHLRKARDGLANRFGTVALPSHVILRQSVDHIARRGARSARIKWRSRIVFKTELHRHPFVSPQPPTIVPWRRGSTVSTPALTVKDDVDTGWKNPLVKAGWVASFFPMWTDPQSLRLTPHRRRSIARTRAIPIEDLRDFATTRSHDRSFTWSEVCFSHVPMPAGRRAARSVASTCRRDWPDRESGGLARDPKDRRPAHRDRRG